MVCAMRSISMSSQLADDPRKLIETVGKLNIALSVRGLRVSLVQRGRDELPLVEGIEFDLSHEQVLGVVGETGAGKTVAMMALAGLLPGGVAAAGALTLGGERRFDLSSAREMRAVRGKEIGIVLQNTVGMFDPLIKLKRQLIEGVVLRKQLG